MLTTTDNPWNPWTNWDEWYAFDEAQGYHSSAYLARIATTADDLPDAINDQAIESAIDEIVNENVLGIYMKIPNPNQPIADVDQ